MNILGRRLLQAYKPALSPCPFRACGTKRPKPCVVCSCGKAVSAAEETASCGSLCFTARKPTHRRRYCGYVPFGMSVKFLSLAIGHHARKRFSVRIYCGQEEHRLPPCLSAGGLDGSLPQISACLGNLGIPSAPSRLTTV